MPTTKKPEEQSFQDKLKAWWETDTAKAVATVIAVLLIPAAVIAWNYATTKGQEVSNELETADMQETNPAAEETAAMQGDETNANGADTQAMTPDQNGGLNLKETVQNVVEKMQQGQEPATNETNTNEQMANNTDQNNSENTPAVGGLGSVEKLPNTSSVVTYTTVNGDNYYSISLKVCGNESFYKANMRKNYLKVGQTLQVTCE